jgi:hypothetical protein
MTYSDTHEISIFLSVPRVSWKNPENHSKSFTVDSGSTTSLSDEMAVMQKALINQFIYSYFSL